MTTLAHADRPHDAARPLCDRRDRPLSEPSALLFVVLALMTFGVLMVYSASRTACDAGDSYYFIRHLVFVPAALGAFAAGAFLPYRLLNGRGVAWTVLATAVVLLGLVLVLGVERNGARRWFVLGLGGLNLSFQPSEFAKLALVLFLAWLFARPEADPRSLRRGFAPAILAIGLVCGLIAKEDFGTGALIGFVAAALCLVAGWRWWYALILTVPGAVGFYFTVLQVPFRLERLRVWLDPWKYFDGAGWHICQSLMGIGCGGLFGVGLGAGIQKLYIPENTTDFIFAVICEEMGLLGGLLVIGLFGAFIWRAGRIVRAAPDRFAFLLSSGILLTIGLQAAMNISVVTGALPAKGIGLPFISYGGSGLVMMGLAVGLLASVARRSGAAEAPARAPQPLVYRPVPMTRAPCVSAGVSAPVSDERAAPSPVDDVKEPVTDA